MDKVTFRWADIGSPDVPGEYPLRCGGFVIVKQEDIDAVNGRGGNPIVIAENASGGAEPVTYYGIVGFRE